jgi:hypothetical protein
MVRMMRAIRWQRETPTFWYDVKGSWRAEEKRAVRAEIEDAEEDIREDEKIRGLWCYLYSAYPADWTDRLLDGYDLPKPPSRERRMPE